MDQQISGDKNIADKCNEYTQIGPSLENSIDISHKATADEYYILSFDAESDWIIAAY